MSRVRAIESLKQIDLYLDRVLVASSLTDMALETEGSVSTADVYGIRYFDRGPRSPGGQRISERVTVCRPSPTGRSSLLRTKNSGVRMPFERPTKEISSRSPLWMRSGFSTSSDRRL